MYNQNQMPNQNNQQWPPQNYNSGSTVPYNNPMNHPVAPASQPVNQQPSQYPQSPYKYPTQIGCIKRDDINLYVNVSLNPPSEQDLKDGTYPGLDVFGKSRFDIYIFKYESKESVKFSIPFKTAKLLFKKTEAVLYGDVSKKNANVGSLTPAYSVKLKGGNEINGRAPAEILLNSPELRDALISQMNYYGNNVSHPKFGKNNMAMAQAIVEALRLQANNMLDPGKIGNSPTIIFEGMRTPNKNVVDQRGFTKARSMKISHTPGSPSPFVVDIMNCYAPPAKGLVGAELRRAVDQQKFNIAVTEEEWYDLVSEMECFINQYRDAGVRNRFRILATADVPRS